MSSTQNSIIAACAIAMTAFIGWLVFSVKPPTEIPPVQNYPLNMEVTSYMGNPELEEDFVPTQLNDKLISIFHSVVYNEKENNYVYTYRISYLGKQKCLLAWEVINQIFSLDKNVDLIPLEPEKTVEFKISSNIPPVLVMGNAWIYKAKELNDKNTIWEMFELNSQSGPLPQITPLRPN